MTEVLSHTQQAAEYAASRGSRIGFLVVLDKHPYGKGAHLPQISDLVRLLPTESRPGARGRSTTLVLALVVPAFPPNPHVLGVASKPRRGRAATPVRGVLSRSGKRGRSSGMSGVR